MRGAGRRLAVTARPWSRVVMLGVAAVVGAAVVVAAPAAHAAVPQAAQVTVVPSMDLPDDSTTSVNVDGEALYPNTQIAIEQCEYKPGDALCNEEYSGSTDANGGIDEDISVSYQLPDSETCDSEPGSTSTTCTVQIVYTSGNYGGQVAASAPLTFAGHDGSPTLAFDPNGQPVDTKVNKTMQGSDGPTQVLVDALNANGSIDSDFSGVVTISFTQPNDADFVVSGEGTTHTSSLSVDAIDGVADFSPIVIDTVGFGDTLVATADGLAQSAPSASFDVTSSLVDCPAGQTCTAHASSPSTGQSATVKGVGGPGTPETVVTASFGGNVAPLHGCSTTADGILTFDGNRQKIVMLRVPTTTYIGTFCWGQPTPFIDQTGSETTYYSSANQEYEGVLAFCSGPTTPRPCINKIIVRGTSETVKVTGGAGDPRISH